MRNRDSNFQLHRFTISKNIAKSFRGGGLLFRLTPHMYSTTVLYTCIINLLQIFTSCVIHLSGSMTIHLHTVHLREHDSTAVALDQCSDSHSTVGQRHNLLVTGNVISILHDTSHSSTSLRHTPIGINVSTFSTV